MLITKDVKSYDWSMLSEIVESVIQSGGKSVTVAMIQIELVKLNDEKYVTPKDQEDYEYIVETYESDEFSTLEDFSYKSDESKIREIYSDFDSARARYLELSCDLIDKRKEI